MESKEKSLLWLVHEGNMSGANLALLEYFEILQELGFSLKVVSPANGSFIDRLRIKQIPVVILPFYPWTRSKDQGFFIKGWLRRSLRNAYAIARVMKTTRSCTAICTNTICVNIGMISAFLQRKPHFLFAHEFGEEDHGFKLAISTEGAYKWMSRLSEKVVLNSKAVYKKWTQNVKDPSRLCILYNCVNQPNEFVECHQKPLTPRFLMLGQISKGKGHELAIDAFERLMNDYKNIELDIIGAKVNNDYFNTLQKKILEKNLHVKLLAPINNPHEVFNQYTALLMCSRQEAFGRVSVEALQSGLPVIGLKSGGTPEIVEHHYNGFLTKKNNTDDLAKTIDKILSMNDKDYKTMTKNALSINKKYNKTVSKNQLKSIFKTLLN